MLYRVRALPVSHRDDFRRQRFQQFVVDRRQGPMPDGKLFELAELTRAKRSVNVTEGVN